MDVVYGLIPMMLIFGFLVVLVFIWMAKSGHFDDLDGAAHSIFMDDDDDIDAHQDADKSSETVSTDAAKSQQSIHDTNDAQDVHSAHDTAKEPPVTTTTTESTKKEL